MNNQPRLRLDKFLTQKGLATTRSQAENFVRMGLIKVNGLVVKKAGTMVSEDDNVEITTNENYVSRAGFKLASVAQILNINFKNKVMLDVGSSTGGFTDFALRHGAKKVLAVDVGTKQLHPSLLGDPKIELHEQTDIRDFKTNDSIDLVIVDVSFISLREILPSLTKFMSKNTQLVAMVKPQFEAQNTGVKHKGVIKNNAMRRKVLKEFESWAKNVFIVVDKADSEVSGSKGNIERFYLLKQAKQ